MALFNIDPFDFGALGRIRQGLVSKAAKPAEGVDEPMPRKGLWRFLNTSVNKKQQRTFVINAETLARLSNSDPITWAIRRTIKAFVNQAEWDIEIDTEDVESELDRWEECALSHLSPYAIGELGDFETDRLDPKTKAEVESTLKSIMKEGTAMSEKKKAIEWYFASVVRKIKAEAESHREPVKRIFERPSERGMENTFRTLQELVLDDILVFDAGCIVKNYNRRGELAEMYHIPGKDVRFYRNEDRTLPTPPAPTYVWEDGGIVRAEFTKDELCYIMQNPQANGYGMSPLEVAAYVITAGIYADEYNIDYFKNSNVPPGVFDLGKDVTEDQRLLFQQMWENEVRGRGGQHRMLFISGSENPKFLPMRTQSNRDMQMMEYMKWTLAVKTACYGISGQDIGFVVDYHRSTGETQRDLSQARGVRTILHLLQQYYNTEIVKKEFPYTDVRFAWSDLNLGDEEKESTIDAADITNGVISRNERRKKLGLKPIAGGDTQTVSAATLLPVSDLESDEEDREDLEEQAMANAEAGSKPQDLTQTPKPGDPAANAEVVPGQPAVPAEEKPDPAANLKLDVNRRKPVTKQYELIHNVVKELQDKGVEATIKIGFSDEKFNKEK